MTYRVYVTDMLRAHIKHTLRLTAELPRYIDFFKPEEKRSAEEITTNIKDKLAKIGGDG